LKNDQTDYHIAKGATTLVKWDIYLNMCRALVGGGNCAPGTAGCQQWDPNKGTGGRASMGSYASLQWQDAQKPGENGHGATAQFTGGDGSRQFEIDLSCDPSAGIGAPTFTVESPPLHYNFEWKTQHACPTKGGSGGKSGLSGGSVFLIILLVGAVVYLAAGITFNKVRRHAHGAEILPNWGFWSSLPGLVKDGVMFLVHKVTKRGQYQQV